MRILVAHHDARIRRRLLHVAYDCRWSQIEVTGSPASALELLHEWHPDLVLMSAPMAERHAASALRHESARPGAPGPRGTPAGSRASERGNLRQDGAMQELGQILAAFEELPVAPRTVAPRAPTTASSSDPLSDSERDILAAMATGSTTAELARAYGVGEDIIDGHILAVLAKLHRLETAPGVVRGEIRASE